MNALLVWTILLPFAMGLVLLVFRRALSREAARQIALLATIATLIVSVGLANRFRDIPVPDAAARSPVEPRYQATYHWLSYGDAPQAEADQEAQPHLQFDFLLGVDG